jgi:hypothetical protein
MPKRKPKDKRICRCECGGWVRGVQDFGRLWTYCDKCTPVVIVSAAALASAQS